MLPKEVFERRLRQAVKSSTFMVQNEAQQKHDFITRTAQLERAVDTKFSFDNGNNIGVVYIDNQVAPYGIFVHQGTKPHTIKPKTKRALRWVPMAGNSFSSLRKFTTQELNPTHSYMKRWKENVMMYLIHFQKPLGLLLMIYRIAIGLGLRKKKFE